MDEDLRTGRDSRVSLCSRRQCRSADYMRQLPGLIRFGSLSEVAVREVGDEVIVEAVGHHHRVADGAPRDLRYIWFITRRNGQVTHFRDYMNPLQLMNL